MPEVNITTNISPATVNTLRMNLYLASSPLAVLDSIEQQWEAENHWTFTNLNPSVNYIYNLFEVDSSGQVLQQYTKSPNFTARSAGSIQVKNPQDIIVNTTPGLVDGATSATFEDWKGWDITIEDIGAGTMQRGIDYSYDIATGTLTLLGQDHVFIAGQRFFVRFEPKVIAGATAVNRDLWSDVLIVTSNTTLTVADIGKKIIIIGSDTYLDITLPDLTTVPNNRVTFFESTKGNHINVTLISSNSTAIDWLEGNRSKLYIAANETLELYAYNGKWRVHNSQGNFKTVGTYFTSYSDSHLNALELNGATLDSRVYARLYNEYVLKLPNKTSFDTWATGNNKFKFSFANSAGIFRIPDLRGQFQINTGGLYGDALLMGAGDFAAQSFPDIRHNLFADGSDIINAKPNKRDAVNWSSTRKLGNQDYDLVPPIFDAAPTIGISGPPVDRFGAALNVSDKLRPDCYAAKRFILI